MNDSKIQKRAIVTGASSGIGEQIAIVLAERGYKVVLVGRRESELLRVAGVIGQSCECYPCDLSSETEVEGLINRYPVTNALVNCAGFGSYGSFARTDWKNQRAMIMVNILALSRLCHHYLDDMLQAQRGHILNVSSTAGEGFAPWYSTYVGTKAFVLQFSRSLALEMPTGVSVSCLIPGPTATEFCRISGMLPAHAGRCMTPANPRDVAEFGVQLMETCRLSGCPGAVNQLKRIVKHFVPERLFSQLVRAHMAGRGEG